MTLLVLDVHPANLIFIWCLTLFVKVKAYRLRPGCPRFLARRIEVLDLDEYFSPNSPHCFKSDAMNLWEKVLPQYPKDCWSVRYHGHLLDFTTKAKQTLGDPFERLIMLQEIQTQESEFSKTYILDSLEFRYLKGIDASANVFTYPTVALLSRINVILDGLSLYVSTARGILLVFAAMVYGCLLRDRSASNPTGPIPYVWNPVHNELTLDVDRRSFPWIVDGEHIAQEDVLFILPRAASRKARPDLRSSGLLTFTTPELYRFIPLRIMLRCVQDLAVLLIRHMLPIPRGLATAQNTIYLLRIATLKPIFEHFRPTCYVNNLSEVGNENPIVVYLNSLGIKTVIYSFSASYYRSGDERCTCDFRAILWANVLATHMVVWHKDARRLFQQHPQQNVQIEVVGPVMSGDESVFELAPHVLRARAGVEPEIDIEDPWYISVFDVPCKARTDLTGNGIYPNFHSMEYLSLFLRDMYRLMHDLKNIVLVFKPLRSFQDPNEAYADEFLEFVQLIRDNERGIVLDDGINPWTPIAIADTCIGVPFTVPPLAGMHYGIPGLFHDPTGCVYDNIYKGISHTVTHGYDQLGSKIRSLMANGSSRNGDYKETIWSEAREFIGEFPGTSSSDRFRKLLLELRQTQVPYEVSRKVHGG